MIKKILDYLRREPSNWTVLYTANVFRTSDGKCVGQNIVCQDQYGNIKTQKVRT